MTEDRLDWSDATDAEITAEVSRLEHISPNRNAELIREMSRRFATRAADALAPISDDVVERLHSTARGLEHAANMIRAGETPQASALDQCAKNCDAAANAIGGKHE